jgi:nitroimidazol reductase NimA-like FMN-containing flavoprotein (pyridoxamine 5'-phosphate oxidase superfamily)
MASHEALALLRTAPVGRLAVVVDDAPDIFPVNHVVDHGTVVFRTAAGTKLSAMDGRQVAFEVDGYDPSTGEAWSVVVHGLGRVIYEPEETIAALGLPIFPWQSGSKPELVRVVPGTITGRRFGVAGGVRDSTSTD